ASNVIGGLDAGAGNTIAYNRGSGVAIDNPNAAFLSNAIFDNAGLGIDLLLNFGAGRGVTPNDPGDSDGGGSGIFPGAVGNDQRNFPILTAVSVSGGGTTITGTLNSLPNSSFLLQFFANLEADPSGFGEGKRLLGSATVTTDGSGNASFTIAIPT